jgi:hypothetical protein
MVCPNPKQGSAPTQPTGVFLPVGWSVNGLSEPKLAISQPN